MSGQILRTVRQWAFLFLTFGKILGESGAAAQVSFGGTEKTWFTESTRKAALYETFHCFQR